MQAALTISGYAFTESTYSNAELSHQTFPKKYTFSVDSGAMHGHSFAWTDLGLPQFC